MDKILREYFENYTGELDKVKVLNFYESRNFIKDEDSIDFTGCDVDKSEIDIMKKIRPDCNWHYFNYYNPRRNINSRSKKLPNITDTDFDYAFSHGVISLNKLSDADVQIDFLKSVSKQCFITFVIKSKFTWQSIIDLYPFLFYESDIEKWEEIENNDINYIVSTQGNVEILHDENDVKVKNNYFLSMHSEEFLRDRYNAEVLNLNENYSSGQFTHIKTLHLRNE